MNQFHVDEEAVFDLARRIDSPELRAEYVDQACGADGELKNRIAELLMNYDRERSFLERPPKDVAPTTAQSISEHPGDTIGPYKLLQQIGEGGFGIVYMAEQSRPVKRKVALKIIKPGMDTKEVVARFEAERQALALMDHPNIAKVFDGGATDTGRPYFVMELVKGVPITEFCDTNKLSTSGRLKLFVQVCQAIQHAHQKGVIHRDIKPSNVMITLHDNQPVPKVIDFGVAKAISQELTEKTMFTVYGQMIGTPQYMSPEQAQMSGLDIDTRSDVYSLGVLLYELLTGTTPLDVKRLRNTAFAELQRLICESEPPKPSTKVSGLGEQSIQIASNRGVDARKLNSQLRGDLDWIVMKALEKDRNRRFESAGSFAGDIQRYLSDEPILARPPSTAYQLRKFVRRNRAKVLATVATAIIAAFFVVGIVRQANLYRQLRQTIQKQAIDDALEALQNVDLDTLEEKIALADKAGADGMLLHILQGRLALEENDWPTAEERFLLAAGENPKSVAPQANLVLAYVHGHQVDKYLEQIRKLDTYTPSTFYDHLFKAEAQQIGFLGNYEPALKTIQDAINKKGHRGCKAARIIQVGLLVNQGNVTGNSDGEFEKALGIIDGLSLFVDNQTAIGRLEFFAHVEAAHTLRFKGELDAADEQYQMAKDLLEDNPFLSDLNTKDLSYILYLEYERAKDSDNPEKDKKVFRQWKRLADEPDVVGGVAGMYGMCAIPQGKVDEALRNLEQIEHPSPDLWCQMGLMYIHTGKKDKARDTYRKITQSKTGSPLVKHDALHIALVLGDRKDLDEVDRCVAELEPLRRNGHMSPWEELQWDILHGDVTTEEEVRERAGPYQRLASDALFTLAMKKWPENRKTSIDLLRTIKEINGPYFALYAARAILYEIEERGNPHWPDDPAADEVDSSGVDAP